MSKRNRRSKGSPKNESLATRFRLHPKGYEVANLLGDQSSIECLAKVFEQASRVLHELPDCAHFEFLDEVHIEDIGHYSERGQLYSFWTQTNQLIILARKTASRAVVGLVDGLSSAIGSKNELVFALTVRTFLEHSAALYDLEKSVSPSEARLSSIWDNELCDKSVSSINDNDKKLRCELLRFVVGRRVQLDTNSMPPLDGSSDRWKKFNDSLRNIPEQFKAKQILIPISNENRAASIQQ